MNRRCIFFIISVGILIYSFLNINSNSDIYDEHKGKLAIRSRADNRQSSSILKTRPAIATERITPVVSNKTILMTLDDKINFFKKFWYLQREYRNNFTKILAPCNNQTEWISHYASRKKHMKTSVNFSHVMLDIQSAGQFSRIVIFSRGLTNKQKFIGGDMWRVFVYGETSVPVTVHDRLDGSYEAIFLITEPGLYYVDLHLDYTLCDGLKDPPSNWFVNGIVIHFIFLSWLSNDKKRSKQCQSIVIKTVSVYCNKFRQCTGKIPTTSHVTW